MSKNIYGGGAQTNINGLSFEQETILAEALSRAGYNVVNGGNVLNVNGERVAINAPKNNLYKRILEPQGINWRKIISRKLLPDEALLNEINNTVYIIEKKFQSNGGSVDEKLQTCDFKLRQYKKLFSSTKFKVEYCYVCNDWFKKDIYKDVRDYIKEVGGNIFYYSIPIKFLGL